MTKTIKISNGVAFFESYPLPESREIQWRGTLEELNAKMYYENLSLHEHVGNYLKTQRRY